MRPPPIRITAIKVHSTVDVPESPEPELLVLPPALGVVAYAVGLETVACAAATASPKPPAKATTPPAQSPDLNGESTRDDNRRSICDLGRPVASTSHQP